MVGFTGSPVRIVYANVTLTRSKLKVKVTELLKFRKLHFCMFSRPISSAILRLDCPMADRSVVRTLALAFS